MKSTPTSPPSNKKEGPKLSPWLIIGLVIMWLLLGWMPKLICPAAPEKFADMFGMVNSLVSAAAFLGLIHTIRLQKHEIELQREELELTRGELANSTAAQRDSAKALAVQILMSSITAQISTLTHRRAIYKDSIGSLKAKMPQGVVPDVAMQQVNEINRQIQSCVLEIASTQEQIDTLHERLVQYDRTWSSKLVEE